MGPVNSSGTNSTVRATRMIAPVSRSFTLSYPQWGRGPRTPSAADAAQQWPLAKGGRVSLVYPKPLQRRPHGVHGTAHHHPISGARRGARPLTARGDRVRECHLARRAPEALRQLRRAAAARTGQRAHDPVVDEGAERRPDRRGVLVRQHADDGEGASRSAPDRKSTRLNSSHLVISYAV